MRARSAAKNNRGRMEQLHHVAQRESEIVRDLVEHVRRQRAALLQRRGELARFSPWGLAGEQAGKQRLGLARGGFPQQAVDLTPRATIFHDRPLPIQA
jgi:hypothetical protein